MLLAIDIGNTNTVLGIFKEDKLLESWRLVSSHNRTVDEYWITTKLLCNDAGIDVTEINSVIIGSVVPELTLNFLKMVKKYFIAEVIVVSNKIDLGFKLLIDAPETLGADRICNIAGASAIYKKPHIVIDLGTATTFDVINKDGNYIGGAISPGVYTSSSELTRKAARLHKIDLEYPKNVIGTNTDEQLKSGIFIGNIAMIEGLCERMQKEYGDSKKMNVIATGGLATYFAKHCPIITHADPQLTLNGLRILFLRNSSK